MNFFPGSVFLFATTVAAGGEGVIRPPEVAKSLILVDFTPLNRVPGPLPTTILLELEAANGAKFSQGVVFRIHGEEALALVFTTLEPILKQPIIDRKDSWDFQKVGNRLIITAWRSAQGETSPISKVRVSSKGTFALDHVPSVMASEGVSVLRDADPPKKR